MTQSTGTLVRQLGVVSATALVVSNMIGTGIFTTSGFLAGDSETVPLFLLIWVVGAVAALAGVVLLSPNSASTFPLPAASMSISRERMGPCGGSSLGWVSFFAGFSAPIAVAALAFSDYLGYFFPALKQANAPAIFGSGDWTFKLGGAQMAASVLILLFTVINVFGIQRVARIQNVLTLSRSLLWCLCRAWVSVRVGRLVAFRSEGSPDRRYSAAAAICDQLVLDLRELQRVERGDVCRGRDQTAG